MKLEQIIEIATECVENEKIPIEGMQIIYKLKVDAHKKLDEELFYKINNDISSFKHNEVIEVNFGGITFIFERD